MGAKFSCNRPTSGKEGSKGGGKVPSELKQFRDVCKLGAPKG